MSDPNQPSSNLIDDIIRDVWVNEDLDAIDRYFHPDALFYGRVRNAALTRDEFHDWVEQFQSMASIISYTRDVSVMGADGWMSHVIGADLVSHVNEKTGRLMGMFFDKVVDGQVIESYANADLLNYFETIGALPENASLIMQAGTTLG